MLKLNVAIESYDMTSNPCALQDDRDYYLSKGIIIYSLSEDLGQDIEELKTKYRNIIKSFMCSSPEYLQQTYPICLNIFASRQYWFHVYEDQVLENLEGEEEGQEDEEEARLPEEPSIDDEEDCEGGTEEMIDFYIDSKFNHIESIPEEIDIMQSI